MSTFAALIGLVTPRVREFVPTARMMLYEAARAYDVLARVVRKEWKIAQS
jgi:hypothetical protein